MTSAAFNRAAPPSEALEPLDDEPRAGPDLRKVATLDDMLAELATVAADPGGYAVLWLSHMAAAGATVWLRIDRDGEEELTVGMPVDNQVRHRSHYLDGLLEDYRQDDLRRDCVIAQLLRRGRFIDERPPVSCEAAAAFREGAA